MNDLIFYDGTPYVNLVQTLKNHCGQLDIRHDVEALSYWPMMLDLADLEAKMGWKATYFLLPEVEACPERLLLLHKGAKIGKHRRIEGFNFFPKEVTTLHGEPNLYLEPTPPAASKLVWSYLEPWDVYISDSMGTWTAAINPGKIWEHELFEHPRRRGLPEAMVYCFRNRPGRVQLLVHGNPLAWREI